MPSSSSVFLGVACSSAILFLVKFIQSNFSILLHSFQSVDKVLAKKISRIRTRRLPRARIASIRRG